MRTTVTLDDDIAAAVRELCKASGIGLSEALNQLARRGLRAPKSSAVFTQRTRSLGLRIDVANVAEALELLEGPQAR
jgi:Arc/MetJ family transcription regulator